ncbi:MAG: JmjC domain-containing protein, partial [Acidimicrobiia bacterium]
LPVEAYTDVLDDGTRLVNPALVLEHLKKGASFVLNQVERHVRAVHDVCAVLEDYFTAPVNATLFVTAPDSAGLRAHFDGQHLFVLQVGGLKEWCLWEPPHPDPADSRVVPEDSLGEPLLQFALEPGDLLYLPRGYVHRAHTTSMFSAHITFLVERVTWQDAIVAECRRLLDRPEFRASLPPGYAVDPPDSDRLDLLQSAARQALLTLDVAAALERSADNEYWKRPMSPRGAFLNWIGAVHDDAPYPC